MDNPNWYCKEVEQSAVRDLSKFEVGCECCGAKTFTFDRLWPKDDYVTYLLERYCTCE